MTAAIGDGALLYLAGALLLLASVLRGDRWLRAGLALAGLTALLDAMLRQAGWGQLVLASLIILANALALLRLQGRGTLDEDALLFHRRHLSRLPAAQAKLLIDQGSFVDGRAGDVLTRAGEPVERLHFLVSGLAAVQVGDAVVGRVGPGDLIGEAALLGGGRASATVSIAEDGSRLWFIPRDRLDALLTAQPAIAAELRAATMAALQDKLERANRARLAT